MLPIAGIQPTWLVLFSAPPLLFLVSLALQPGLFHKKCQQSLWINELWSAQKKKKNTISKSILHGSNTNGRWSLSYNQISHAN